MKKLLIIFVVLIFLLAGCAKEFEAPSNPSVTPYEKGKYYEKYNITKHSYPQIQYIIFDGNHEVLDYEVIEKSYPKITMMNGLVKVRVGCGTACFNVKYYNPEKRLISEWFFKPIIESDTMVVYLDYVDGVYQLIVQDIFDKQKFYKGFARDFSKIPYPVTSADFLYDGLQLRITYKTGQDGHEVTEILDLYLTETGDET